MSGGGNLGPSPPTTRAVEVASVKLRDRFRRDESLVTRHIVGETLLIPVTGTLADLADIFSLNDTGAFVWERLDGTRDLAAIHGEMVEAFEVDEARARADLLELVGTLVAARLVAPVD